MEQKQTDRPETQTKDSVTGQSSRGHLTRDERPRRTCLGGKGGAPRGREEGGTLGSCFHRPHHQLTMRQGPKVTAKPLSAVKPE